MTGEEGWSNPHIMVNGASIRVMERGATPIGGASASRDAKRGKKPQIHHAERTTPARVSPCKRRWRRWSQIAREKVRDGGRVLANRDTEEEEFVLKN